MSMAVENVWDYPRPPRLEPVEAVVTIVFAGQEIVRTEQALRVLETSHPPTYYIPPEDILEGLLSPAAGGSFCEWKGRAVYWSLNTRGRSAQACGWSYPAPTPDFLGLRDHVAFYASRMDRCRVGDLEVRAQPGDFYGGWVTDNLRGPFKGGPGSAGW